MKRIFIAMVVAITSICLLGSYRMKALVAKKRVTETPNTTVKQQYTPIYEVLSDSNSPAADETPEEPDVNQLPPLELAEVTEEILEDIKATRVDEKAIVLSEAINDLSQICITAVNTQKALLAINLNNDANNGTQPKDKKEQDNGSS